MVQSANTATHTNTQRYSPSSCVRFAQVDEWWVSHPLAVSNKRPDRWGSLKCQQAAITSNVNDPRSLTSARWNKATIPASSVCVYGTSCMWAEHEAAIFPLAWRLGVRSPCLSLSLLLCGRFTVGRPSFSLSKSGEQRGT